MSKQERSSHKSRQGREQQGITKTPGREEEQRTAGTLTGTGLEPTGTRDEWGNERGEGRRPRNNHGAKEGVTEVHLARSGSKKTTIQNSESTANEEINK